MRSRYAGVALRTHLGESVEVSFLREVPWRGDFTHTAPTPAQLLARACEKAHNTQAPLPYSVRVWLNCGSCAHTFCSCPLMRCAAACREREKKEVAYCKDSPWHVQTQSRGSQLGSGWREGEKGCALPVASARTLLGGDGDALVRRGASVVHSPARRSARRGAKGRREFDQARCTLSYLFNTA